MMLSTSLLTGSLLLFQYSASDFAYKPQRPSEVAGAACTGGRAIPRLDLVKACRSRVASACDVIERWHAPEKPVSVYRAPASAGDSVLGLYRRSTDVLSRDESDALLRRYVERRPIAAAACKTANATACSELDELDRHLCASEAGTDAIVALYQQQSTKAQHETAAAQAQSDSADYQRKVAGSNRRVEQRIAASNAAAEYRQEASYQAKQGNAARVKEYADKARAEEKSIARSRQIDSRQDPARPRTQPAPVRAPAPVEAGRGTPLPSRWRRVDDSSAYELRVDGSKAGRCVLWGLEERNRSVSAVWTASLAGTLTGIHRGAPYTWRLKVLQLSPLRMEAEATGVFDRNGQAVSDPRLNGGALAPNLTVKPVTFVWLPS